MTGRRALVGLSLLCAFAFSAFSAAGASAATSGITAVTCVAGTGDYTDAHCDNTAEPAGTGSFKHVALAGSTTTNVITTNAGTKNATTESTPIVLEATVGGIPTKLEGASAAGTGTLENVLEGEVHKIVGSGITSTYTGVVVVNPINCKVHSPGQPAGTLKTKVLKGESVEGTPMTAKLSPEVGTEFIKFEFENNGGTCAINGIQPTVTGTISSEISGQMTNESGVKSIGSTGNINVTKASGQLKVGGQNASVKTVTTGKMEGGNPLAGTGPPFP